MTSLHVTSYELLACNSSYTYANALQFRQCKLSRYDAGNVSQYPLPYSAPQGKLLFYSAGNVTRDVTAPAT